MDKKMILIVEDDQNERLALNVRFRDLGYDTCFATDGLSSISVALKHKPDLIVLDIRMPAGDGFVVMERLKNIPHLSSIPIIVISVNDAGTFKQRALDAGAKMFFQKPADNDELVSSVRQWLGEASTSPTVYEL